MNLFYTVILVVLGLASGGVVAGGIFAFISAIGIVPRMAKRTETQKYIPLQHYLLDTIYPLEIFVLLYLLLQMAYLWVVLLLL